MICKTKNSSTDKVSTRKTPYKVGLTGGIACGKTTVSDMFLKLGATVIDTDLISREVVEPGSPVLEELARTFGTGILQQGGTLDRRALRKLVFENTQELARLNAIMLPAIFRRLEEKLSCVDTDYVIIVIPLLFENHLENKVDRTLVIDCPEEIQIARLTKRDNVTEDLAKAMLASQLSRSQRIKKADDLIQSNVMTLEETAQVVLELHKKYHKFAQTELL